jgi:hypothetical protein
MILLLTRSPGYYDARVQPLFGREAASLIRCLLSFFTEPFPSLPHSLSLSLSLSLSRFFFFFFFFFFFIFSLA